jgi:hypothetical protein
MFGRPRAATWILVIAVVLVLPCITVGFAADDHVQRVAAEQGAGIADFQRGFLDLFTFSSGRPEEVGALRDAGVFGWWVAEDLKLSFFRPLSSLTHQIDYLLWPDAAWAMYLHSIAWFFALLLAARALYSSLHRPWVAALALMLYGLDDARGPVVGWISNRNALVMGTFAFASLWAYHRWAADEWKPGRWLAPMALALAFASAEGAIAVAGYLASYMVFVERSPWPDRLRRAAPMLAVIVGWMVLYRVGGWGTAGSGVYLDPGAEPLAFVERAGVRTIVMLVGQLALPWSDFWPAYPPSVVPWMFFVALLTLAAVTALVWPALRKSSLARFYGAGMLLSVVPIAGTFPADRLLTLVGLGGAGLLAVAVERGWERPRARKLRKLGLGLMLAYHAVLAPLLLPLRVQSMNGVRRSLAMFDRATPDDPSIEDKTVVVLHSPNDGLVGYLPFIRASQRRPRPARLRLLAGALAEVAVTREDERTLRIRPEGGYLADMANRMQRGLSRPFEVGETIIMPDLEVTVLSVTEDGRPAEARFRFDVPLEDSSLVWRRWNHDHYESWTPIAVGQTVTLPAVEVAELARVLIEDDGRPAS